MTIGQRITQKRKELGLSQEEFGNKLNVSRQAVHKWESDNGLPEVENLQAICRIFNVSIDWLLNGEDALKSESAGPSEGEAQKTIVIKEVQKKRTWVFYVLIAILAIIVVSMSIKISRIENNYNNLFGTINWLRHDMQMSINGITHTIQDTLDKYNSSVLDSSVKISKAEYETNTIYFDVNLVPKTYTENMKVQLDVISTDGDGKETRKTVFAEQSDEKHFIATVSCPLTDDMSIMCTFIRAGEKENVLLGEYTGMYSSSFEFYDVLWPVSFALNRDKTAFDNKYCELQLMDFSRDELPVAESATIAVSLLDEDENFVAQYKKCEGLPDIYVHMDNESDEGRIWFERPADLKLDPAKTYTEKVEIVDIYGRKYERIWNWY